MSTIPAGTYRARPIADEVQFGYTKRGTEQIAIPVRIVDGECAGQVVTWFGTFAEGKATEIAIKALRACGWQGSDLSNLDGIGAVEVEAEIAYETWEGQERMKVRWLNPIGGGRVKLEQPMTDAQRRAFATRLKGAALAVKPLPLPAATTPSNGRSGAQPPYGAGDAWEPPMGDDLPI